jgi:hypothetical protein
MATVNRVTKTSIIGKQTYDQYNYKGYVAPQYMTATSDCDKKEIHTSLQIRL